MILRKPYAFLIKYFMIIHILLSGLMIYVCLQYRHIIAFIKEYINNTASISIANTIIGIMLFGAIVVIIGISAAIFWLMKYKKKPKLLYLLNIILYAVLLIVTLTMSVVFSSLSDTIIDAKTIRLYRDTVNITLILQYIFIIAMVIRTLGFDIKKFNFSADAQELAIETGDDEEVEINVGFDTHKIMRVIRRYMRELKYYYEENKLVIRILGIVVIVIIVLLIMPKFVGKERVHGQNEIVSTTNFQMNVLGTYSTKLKSDGTDISVKGNTYVITKIGLLGLYNDKYSIDTDRFVLKIGKSDYYPSLKYYNYFSDIGYGYNKQSLVYNTTKPYILVFVVNDSDIKKGKTLVYTDVNLDELKVGINPIDLDKANEVDKASINEDLNYKDTVIGDGSIKVNSFEFAEKYDLVYASYNRKILKLDMTNNIGRYSNYEFFSNFVTLKYIKDNNTKIARFNNRTDRGSTSVVYLDATKDLEEADSIYLEIKIRNKIYKYIIKGEV